MHSIHIDMTINGSRYTATKNERASNSRRWWIQCIGKPKAGIVGFYAATLDQAAVEIQSWEAKQ